MTKGNEIDNKKWKCDGPTDRPIDRWMDGPTDEPTKKMTKKSEFFCHFHFFSSLYFFRGGTQQRLKFFWWSWATPTTFLRSWLTPHSHNLGLNQCKSQFLKNLICCFFTWKSNLDILKWSNCHKISVGGYQWCGEATD